MKSSLYQVMYFVRIKDNNNNYYDIHYSVF